MLSNTVGGGKPKMRWCVHHGICVVSAPASIGCALRLHAAVATTQCGAEPVITQNAGTSARWAGHPAPRCSTDLA